MPGRPTRRRKTLPIPGDETTPQVFEDDDATITLTGTISTPSARAHAIRTNGDGATVNIDGIEGTNTITTNGFESHGVYLDGSSGTLNHNSGTIKTKGASGYGVYLVGSSGTLNINGDSTISTNGFEAHGVYLVGSSGTLNIDGTIEVSGADAYGIYLTGSNSTTTVKGTVSANNGKAIVVSATDINGSQTEGIKLIIFSEANISGEIDLAAGTLEFAGDLAIDGALNSSGASTTLDLSTNDVTVAANSAIGENGSILKVAIDGSAENSGSLATSTNVVITLNDSLVISLGVSTFDWGSTVTIIDGDAGGGTLELNDIDALQGNMAASARLIYTLAEVGEDLTVTVDKQSEAALAGAGLSRNALAVNVVVDDAFSSNTTMMSAINGMADMAGLNDSLESLAPEVTGSAVVGSVSAGTAATQTVSTRLASLRTGISAGQGLSSGDPLAGNRTFWMQGFGVFADQDEREGFDGFDALTTGFAVGADKPLAENITGGLAFSIANTDVDSDSSANQTQIKSYQATAYGSYDLGSGFLDGLFSVAYNDYEGSRDIIVGGVVQQARADYSGIQSSIKAELGREFMLDNEVVLTPSIALQHTHVLLDSYTETEAGAANLKVDRQNYDSLYMTVQSKFSRTLDIEANTLTPEFRIGYMYEALDEKISTTSTFTGGGGSFKTIGFDPANHSLIAGVGMTFSNTDNFEVIGTYDTEIKQDYFSHSFLIKGEWKL